MLNNLNARQKYILMTAQTETVDTEILASRLQVSKRTIQRDLLVLQECLSEYQIALETLSSGVFTLKGDQNKIADVMSSIGRLPSVYVLNPRERIFYLMSELLWANGLTKIAYLAHRLHISEASVSHDLDEVESLLATKQLQLVRKRGYGLEIIGLERAKREMLAEIFHEFVPIDHFLRIWMMKEDEPQDNYLRFIRLWFSEERIQEVRRVLLDEVLVMELPLHDEAFYNFMIHVLLTLERLGQGQSLMQTSETMQEDSEEFRVAKKVLMRLASNKDVPLSEIRYLANHLRGTKVQMVEENWGRPLNVTIMELAYRIARVAGRLDQHHYLSDQHLIAGLAYHLEPAIYRAQNGMSIRNPLLPELQRQYPELFATVREASTEVFRDFGITMPDTEIGYLTMHFGAARERQRARQRIRVIIVCPNGISSAELLASRIRVEFPQLRIVSMGAISAIQPESSDFIISTVPLSLYDRVVTVSPFLMEEDIRKIQEFLDIERNVPYVESLPSNDGEEILRSRHDNQEFPFEVNIYTASVSSIDEVIQWVAHQVVQEQFSDNEKDIIDVITRREKIGSITIPGKSIALLHARSETMHRSYVGAYRLNQPINMMGVGNRVENISAIMVLLAPLNEKSSVVEKLSKLSVATIMWAGFSEAISSKSKEELNNFIREIVSSNSDNRSDS